MPRGRALASALAARGVPPLAGLEWHDSLVSTSDRVKALARDGAPAWTAVLADEQTGGRGREGRRWTSPPGGLYLSVLLRPAFVAVGLLPLAAGVAAAEAAGEFGVRAELKWPNDVLAGGRKLAGVLAEAASGPRGVEWVSLGIGVNVRLSAAALPAELRGSVAALEEGGRSPTVASVAATVLAQLGLWYDAVSSDPASVVAAWRARALPWWGEPIEIRIGGETLRARLRALDADGALVIETPDGRARRVVSGEVLGVRRAG